MLIDSKGKLSNIRFLLESVGNEHDLWYLHDYAIQLETKILSIENGVGESISLEKLVTIADVLNVSVDDLLVDCLNKYAGNNVSLEIKD